MTESSLIEIPVAPAVADFKVASWLKTYRSFQFAAYYDHRRRLTIAKRRLGDDRWEFAVLPTSVGVDSHNYMELAIDPDQQLHVSGNMHTDPLIYFRTDVPLDISTFRQVKQMVGTLEDRVTYPHFLNDQDGALLFTYRDGMSGNGNQIYNKYDCESRTWSRYLNTPLTDGEGLRSAYLSEPAPGPDGWYHLVWVWRDTQAAETNHDVCYARSTDLRVWQTSTGERLDLPIKLASCEIVDPVPAGGGTINGNTSIGFDLDRNVVLTYQKFDQSGFNQFYNARREHGHWVSRQITDWKHRWEFSGLGTLQFEMTTFPVRTNHSGRLVQNFWHKVYGRGTWLIDPASLLPIDLVDDDMAVPESIYVTRGSYPGLTVAIYPDRGESPKGSFFVLRAESLAESRDQQQESSPPPQMLSVCEVPIKQVF